MPPFDLRRRYYLFGFRLFTTKPSAEWSRQDLVELKFKNEINGHGKYVSDTYLLQFVKLILNVKNDVLRKRIITDKNIK